MKSHSPWIGVLLVTIVINVPFFSPRLVFVHDTLQQVFEFHYFYSEFYFQHELPNWSPFIGYGTPSDLSFLMFRPSDHVVMIMGLVVSAS